MGGAQDQYVNMLLCGIRHVFCTDERPSGRSARQSRRALIGCCPASPSRASLRPPTHPPTHPPLLLWQARLDAEYQARVEQEMRLIEEQRAKAAAQEEARRRCVFILCKHLNMGNVFVNGSVWGWVGRGGGEFGHQHCVGCTGIHGQARKENNVAGLAWDWLSGVGFQGW